LTIKFFQAKNAALVVLINHIRLPELFTIPGDHDEGETPVPIPNTEAKPLGADDTARVTEWESRTSPGFFLDSARRAVFDHISCFHGRPG
jgi:hypothetical protein